MFKFVQHDNEPSQEPNTQKLEGLSQNALRLLVELSDYLKQMKLSIYDAFSIFDTDGSGHIGVHEF